jgi:N-acetylglucosaminyl-diphospho-decaprenol L-rhamnosyltransferase
MIAGQAPEEPKDDSPHLRKVSPGAARVRISVVIVTWNSERWIERCLRSIAPACGDLAHEVIVYDNASTDTTLQQLQALTESSSEANGLAAALVIRSVENHGFAAGTNRALAESSGKYVFLLNPDCELSPGALAVLYDFLEADADAAAAAPLLVDESGGSQREFQLRRFPTLRTFASEVFGLDRFVPKNRTTANYRYRDLDLTRPQRVEQPAAAALLIRRSVVEEIGPFDEQFEPAWFEDVDYCRRLAVQGKAVFVVPAARARHFGGSSLENLSFAEFTDAFYRNMWRYARKWLRPAKSEALRWIIIAGMLLRAVAALVGIAHREAGRLKAFRAYMNVAKKAFRRWSPA